MISFEYKDKESIELHLDQSGAERLIKELERITRKGKGNDDAHLISDEWGGDFLTSKLTGDANKVIHAVKVMYWDR